MDHHLQASFSPVEGRSETAELGLFFARVFPLSFLGLKGLGDEGVEVFSESVHFDEPLNVQRG